MVGFEFPSYSVLEFDGPQMVCVEILNPNEVQLTGAETISLTLSSDSCSDAQGIR